MDQKYIVALELSGTQVKGAIATVNSATAFPTIDVIVSEDNADCVQYGRVQNLINATKYTKSVLVSLQSDPLIVDGKINGVYVALAGRSLGSEPASAEITLASEMEITNDILKSLFVEASKKASTNKRVLKVLPRKYTVDNQTIPNPVGALGRKLRGEFTLVTCNPNNQRNLSLLFEDKDRVNMPVKSYIIAPLAVADMVLNEEEKQLGCVLVDFGYQTTTISIYKDRSLQYLATLPMGSHNITRDISVGLNMTIEKAEIIKCTQADAMSKAQINDETPRIENFVGARAYEIVANIKANLDYANYKATDLPGGFILTGRGSKLKNFDNLLSEQTKMRVRGAELPKSISCSMKVSDINPEDNMALISVIGRVSRLHDFESCVTFPERPEVKENEPATPTKTVQQPLREAEAPAQRTVVQREVDEDNWADDDPIPTVKTTEKETARSNRKKSRRSWLDALKENIGALVSDSSMDTDADLDNN